jgi:sortase A
MRWVQAALLATAVGMLGYCAFVLTDTWIFQRQASRTLDRSLHLPAPIRGPEVATMGGLVGRLEIPRLEFSVIVAEGTKEFTLRRAAGHIEGTEFPGQPGNIGIAGHRDTFFRPLQKIQQGDVIVLTTLQGEYRYRVVSARIVEPSDVAVLNSDGHEVLTLVTCHPFYFVGPAPNRFIVRAERARVISDVLSQQRKASL